MTAINPFNDSKQWQQQAYKYLTQEEYGKAASLYEQALEAEPEIKLYYWQLGLLMLLQGQEAEAQTTWMLGMMEGEPEQIDRWTGELLQILHTEAQRREELADYSTAWAIRQHIREINPNDVNNLLLVIKLAVELETLTEDAFVDLGVVPLLQSGVEVNLGLLLQVLQSVLAQGACAPGLVELVEAVLPYIPEPITLLEVLLPAVMRIAYEESQPALAVLLTELYLRLDPENVEVLGHLAAFYQNAGDYQKGIETARRRYSLVQNLPDQIFANHLILRGLMSAGGRWQEALTALLHQEALLRSLIEENPASLDQVTTLRLFTSGFFFPYFRDELSRNRPLQNQISQVCQNNIQQYAGEQVERYQQRHLSHEKVNSKTLKVGYLSHCLNRHSVGWLARWLFQHHDRDRFQLYAYFVGFKQNDPLQDWYVSQVDYARKPGTDYTEDSLEIAEKIHQDEINILIDLDSITLDLSGEVMALKPAPVQATWLGWDASGLPAVDYFIADPYVLPDSAQNSYSEKIWRLPKTYVAVNGFEVGVPTLRRDQLDIPSDAVVYFSTQRGYKRHPDTVRLQIKVLKEVPDSYFLVKGVSDQESIKSLFHQIAEEEGIGSDRLRFLSEVASEAVHRANLGIADVVLDTYPYNGATTTLETLWMGIPMVTRVGQQFASRNSYTMMMNVGVTEGIAWTDEEYIEWGMRLGKDVALRQRVAWQLRQSRQTAPLWNAKQFTREMEDAYQQMWQEYLEKT